MKKKSFYSQIKFFMFLVFIVALLFFLITTFVSNVSVSKGSISLLTVAETENGSVGGTADLLLEVRPGSGRVFIDSFPLTKIDTQISTRFAKEMACNFLDVDCSKKDFFYTIRTGSNTVGGPSAGAAITILTISVLSDLKLDDSVVLTGTINSGGIIGPVSGIEQKAQAAKDTGFKKILVPKRSILSEKTLDNIKNVEESIVSNNSKDYNDSNASDISKSSNISIVYSDTFEKEGISVVPVSMLEDALFHFTGEKYDDYSYEINVPDEYQVIMSKVAQHICDRSKTIVIDESLLLENNDTSSFVKDTSEYASKAMFNQDFYSAASFCFTINTALRRLQYSDYDVEGLEQRKKELLIEVNIFADSLVDKNLNTISELETMMIVKERVFEAKNALEKNVNVSDLDIGYVEERLNSAEAWSAFFEMKGKQVVLDEKHLHDACLSKIAEAEEKLNYLEYITGFDEYFDEIDEVRDIYNNKDYAFCLFKAAKVKAEANSIILTFAITKEKVSELIEDQLTMARIQINKQTHNFPIMGYSYYDYASSLKDSRYELAVTFSEYASEFSNLDMYFPKSDNLFNEFKNKLFVNYSLKLVLFSFLSGFFVGVLFLFYLFNKKQIRSRK